MVGAPGFGADGESLQTDVMRFMAIIAFCLIAILALVRNVEAPAAPPPVAAKSSAAVPVLRAPPQPAPKAAPEVAEAEAEVVEAPPEPRVVQQAPTPLEPLARTVLVEPAPVPEPAAAPEPEPAPAPEPRPAPAPAAAAQAQPPADEQPTESAADERGLRLRFASDRDFMRLITKGEIQVYAFQPGSRVYGLAKNYEFSQAPAPGRLYELLPETIPRLVMAALQRATSDATAFTWGIRLPAELERKIRAYVDNDAVGELVIDRYGEVHHELGA